MAELSRDELKAYLNSIENQVKASLRIAAAESKSVQQAHNSLRADLSTSLIKFQADQNEKVDGINHNIKILTTEVRSLQRQRRILATIIFTLVLILGMFLGIIAGGSYYLIEGLNIKQYISNIENTNLFEQEDTSS